MKADLPCALHLYSLVPPKVVRGRHVGFAREYRRRRSFRSSAAIAATAGCCRHRKKNRAYLGLVVVGQVHEVVRPGGRGRGRGHLPLACSLLVSCERDSAKCDSDHSPNRDESDAVFLNDGIVVVGSELELQGSKNIVTRAFHKLEARTTRRQPCQYCEVSRPIE